MKKISVISLLFMMGWAIPSSARQGYRIHLKMPDVKDSIVFLAHYYGKGGDRVYKTDSARFKNGVAEFNNPDPSFVGGIYMILLPSKQNNFEFLLNNGDDFSITAHVGELPAGVTFKNSPENDRFEEYVAFLKDYGARQQQLQKDYKSAKNAADSAAVRKTSATSSKELTDYRKNYVAKYPNTLLAEIFNALELPQVPEGPHYLADGKTIDSSFSYNYYKAHYWDKFDFQDDRLIYTPIYDAKLDEYMNKLVLPWPDSVEKESDMLLKKSRGTKDVFKYTLYWLTHNVEASKVMGMDEVFVYLVENYYMKGDAFWLKNEELAKYTDRAQKIAPNVIGNLAPEVKVPNIITGKDQSLYDIKADYTILVFYSPTCGHCQHELPELDSLYNTVLKKKGVKIFAVATEGEERAITDFIGKYKTGEWINGWDPNHVGDWRGKYDVYSTPTIYLLDEKKIIRGKRLDHTNIASVIDMLERKAKAGKTAGSK
jgi:thiol-disulfide isomerase/thioredoxin